VGDNHLRVLHIWVFDIGGVKENKFVLCAYGEKSAKCTFIVNNIYAHTRFYDKWIKKHFLFTREKFIKKGNSSLRLFIRTKFSLDLKRKTGSTFNLFSLRQKDRRNIFISHESTMKTICQI
jgi:hypothetical protein